MPRIRLFLVLLLAVGSAAAQGASLVADINKNTPPNDGSSPFGGFQLGGVTYFFAADFVFGRELYRTDGTTAGTRRVDDHFPRGAGWSPQAVAGRIAYAGATRAYFFHGAGAQQYELWSTDGTAGGARKAATFRELPDNAGVLGDRLVFSTDDGEGREVWSSDGTATGTKRLRNLNGRLDGVRGRFVLHSGWLYYVGLDAATGTQLWRTDGVVVRKVLDDLRSGVGSSEMELIGSSSSWLFLAASGGVTGRELWVSDGVSAGARVLDKMPGPTGIAPEGVGISYGGRLLFVAGLASGRELWVSDGTLAGTSMLKDINPGGPSSDPRSLTLCGGKVVFHAVTQSHGREPWVTDGTPQGTQMLADVDPGVGSGVLFDVVRWVSAGQLAVLATRQNGIDAEVVATDGSPAGTARIDMKQGQMSSYTEPIGVISPTEVLLVGTQTRVEEREPWVTAGTLASTRQLADLNGQPGVTFSSLRSNVDSLVGKFPDQVLLLADDTSQFVSSPHPWSIDVSVPGAQFVGPRFQPIFGAGALFGETLVYGGTSPLNGWEPWIYRPGSGSGPRMLSDLNRSIGSSRPTDFVAFQNGVYFSADDGATGHEPWFTNGTPAGTQRLGDLMPGSTPSIVNYEPARVGSLVFFYADSPGAGYEPWVTDGTPSGTRMVRDLMPGPANSVVQVSRFLEFRGAAYFCAETPSGPVLLRSDGTAAGTTTVTGFQGGRMTEAVAVGSTAMFFVEPTARQLWMTDGTARRTTLVADFGAGGAIRVQGLTAGSGGVYVLVLSGAGRQELMHADVAGTVTRLGQFGSDPFEIYATGSREVWFGPRRASPFEVWRSDGTVAGTSAMFGRTWLEGRVLGMTQGQLLFAAHDALHGVEPWSAPIGASVESFGFGCGRDARAPSLQMSDPVLGGTLDIACEAAAPTSSGLLLIGTPGAGFVLPNRCTAYLDNPAVWAQFATDGQGSWSTSFPVPNAPALRGLRFATSAVVLAPGALDSTRTLIGAFGR